MESINKSIQKLAARQDFRERYRALRQEVEKHPDVQSFLYDHQDQITDEIVDRSLMKLYEYTEQSKNCRDCPSLNDCKNLIQGYHPRLVLSGKTIDLQYDKCPSKLHADEKLKQESLIKSIHIPKDILHASLNDIDRDEPAKKEVLVKAIQFVQNYQADVFQKGLYVYGSFGIGKTFILGAIANELARKKHISSMIVYVPEFMRELKSSLGNQTFEAKLEAVKKAPVLMLDDIGAEALSSWTRDEVLGPLLQYRMLEQLPTFFSSNFDLKELTHHLTYTQRGEEEGVKAARIMERIKYLAQPAELKGRNYRE
ncbi:primosomal protein DnaI [Bacillus lacus]|uniref:Primosomal protein DnaI n=1 Tax=Metabacillus lacus TaxID=1983721 RepID=A0A7X2IXR9_9BACI|nr:primosomal protein DnaI [Metabacillus lacus]MRX71777.1 primosomal protein DnaI [Metabacillus lacus]